VNTDSERCKRCDRSAIEADDLDNWTAINEGDLICPGCQTQQERIAGARSSLEGMAHLTRLRERRSH
jgi:Zn finger protein HypA/HybF involved in hydrogenase expression